ncbi:MAG: TIGR02206 family membrane protein [Saprospiraceae bacterium]|nr:TIGR02206 family membrane protein [Saprospiraceae bacterium]
MDILFTESQPFESFTAFHWWPLIIVAVIGIAVILISRKYFSVSEQWNTLFWLSTIPALTALMGMIMPCIEGDFNIQEDLPLHICRFVALAAPFVIYKKNKFWMGIFYFWILAGTLNANITPDVEYNFPHWTYFSYWLEHSFLVILPLYYVLVLRVNIVIKDLKNAFWMANAFLIMTLIVNWLIGSNYMYSRQKPPVASLLDVLGPWPIYLITGQLLAGVLFFIVYLPFFFKKVPHGTDHN